MNNFIELHFSDGTPVTFNVGQIINYFHAKQKDVENANNLVNTGVRGEE